jgi:hypothetical protein
MSQYFQGTQPYTTKLNNLSTLSWRNAYHKQNN